MAGIGFRLRKILDVDTYTRSISAHIQSALVMVGPWILSSLAIFVLSYFKPANISDFENLYFRSSVIYIFCFSLIYSGLLYMSLSRYLADKLYLRQDEALVPAFNSAALFTFCFQGILALLFFFLVGGNPWIRLFICGTFMALSMIWVVTIFLTALQDYTAITWSFVIGIAAVIGFSLWFGHQMQIIGYYSGYFLGHMVLLTLLASRIFIEFRSIKVIDRSVFIAFRKGWLVAAGFFFSLGSWMDKIVFWLSPRSRALGPFFHIFGRYEIAVFLATLTIIPMLTIFLVHVETDFYVWYKKYYRGILSGESYPEIMTAKKAMLASLRWSTRTIVVGQILVSLLVLALAPEIVTSMDLPTPVIPIFRIAILAAFLQGVTLLCLTLILYFDQPKRAALVGITFTVTNGLFTWATVYLNDSWLGYGYFGATLVSSFTAFMVLEAVLKNLEYLTFAPQPILTVD